MAPPPPPFQLSATLNGHQADVRSVFSPSPSIILSSSRDKSAIAWINNGAGWVVGRKWDGLGGFVGAVWGGQINGEAYVVTGSQDSVLNAYLVPKSPSSSPDEFAAATSNDPNRTMIGHTSNVCCVDGLVGGDGLVSGSWDTTAIVWSSTFQQVQVLKAHSQTVWSVRSISPTQLLTGSADKTIVLWNKTPSSPTSPWKESTRFFGHTDAVRCIAAIPGGATFASSSNDGTIIIFALETGDALITLHGHTSFVYSLAFLPEREELVSVGEDRTMRIWNETGKNVQTIPIPSTSVWTVGVLANGDLVTGSSDGAVRVWTREEARVAGVEERKALEEEVGKQKVDQQQIGDVKKDNVPGIDALAADGKKEGQVIMVKNEKNVVEAYQWSSGTWQKIGEVVDAVGSNRRQLHNGVEYDYVFDVDIQEGAPPLKLPYNAADNPYMAAKTFLEKNDLPPSYLEEVVKFIEKSTAGVTLGTASNDYIDPYTGASRYQSSASSFPTTGSQPSTTANEPYVDPYSGTARYTPGSASASAKAEEERKKMVAARAKEDVLPVETYLGFKAANLEALGKKLGEMEGGRTLGDAVRFVGLPKGALPSTEETKTNEGWEVGGLVGVLESWEAGKRFPVLDLVRLLASVSPSLAAYRSSSSSTIVQVILAAAEWNKPWEATKERETNTMLAFRALANLFSTKNGKEALLSEPGCEELLRSIIDGPSYNALNKNIRVALSTVVLNYSVLALQAGLPRPEIGNLLLEIILRTFSNESSDGESAYRTAVAFGNLLLSPSVSGSLHPGKSLQGKLLVKDLSSRFAGEKRLQSIAEEIGRVAI